MYNATNLNFIGQFSDNTKEDKNKLNGDLNELTTKPDMNNTVQLCIDHTLFPIPVNRKFHINNFIYFNLVFRLKCTNSIHNGGIKKVYSYVLMFYAKVFCITSYHQCS